MANAERTDMKCEGCGKPASIHLTDIVDGQKIEKHLCEECAAGEGLTVKSDVPISQLLEDFILQSSAGGVEMSEELQCEICGLTFGEFRKSGVLGCPHDYVAFEEPLVAILERAQRGNTEHVGKVPKNSGRDQKRLNAILKLRAQLRGAITAEDYELAAKLRDEIKRLEAS